MIGTINLQSVTTTESAALWSYIVNAMLTIILQIR